MDSFTAGRLSTDPASSSHGGSTGRLGIGIGIPRRRLSKPNRDNNSNRPNPSSSTAMVDATPQPARPVHQQQHSRSSFLGFSFAKNRANSAPSTHQPLLSTVREAIHGAGGRSSANGNQTDEFGGLSVSRPAPQQHQSAPGPSSSSTPQAQSGPQMAAANTPAGPSSPQQGLGAGQQQQQEPQQQPQSQQPPPQRQLHPEIRSIVNLSTAHAHKIYFSGPLVKHVERHTDGKIVGKEEPWREVWAQLGGTTLSVWDMKEIEEASKRGTEVPPTYLNITDASIHVLGAVTMPGPDGTPVKYLNVITLTTAGLNLLLFSCPSPQDLVSWTAALRLSAYEKSRLEELYTAHLLRMSLSENGIWKDPRSPLINGRMEGWVKIRINGQTDWKRLWMCVQTGQADGPVDASMTRRHRMSSLFARASHEHNSSITSIPSPDRPGGPGGSAFDPRLPHITFYTSNKARDRKKGLLTLTGVTQVFAVYPERPELISRSTLIKMEGFIGDEELAGEWRSREGWVLMMPEPDPGKLGSLEMLKWLVALHDAFSLYGRPAGYTWNPRDPISLMFAYPVGAHKDNLFLDRDLAESVDPREDRGSVVRQKFRDILLERMYGPEAGQRMAMGFSSPTTGNGSAAPSLPPIQTVVERPSEESQDHQMQQERAPQNGAGGTTGASGGGGSFQLPPLSFDINTSTASNLPPVRDTSSLSPITERTDTHSLSRGSTQDRQSHISPSTSLSARGATKQSTIEEESPNILGARRVESPPSMDAPSNQPQQQRQTVTTSGSTRPAQLAPRFSQDSGAGVGSVTVSASTSLSASGSGSGSGGAGSATKGARSPPLSPESSVSRYSQPEGPLYSSPNAHITGPEQQVQSLASTSTVQESALERERDMPQSSPPSSFASQMQRQFGSPMSSVPPRMQQLHQQQHQQHQNEPVPPTPASMFSTATHMSSPFSINELNKEQPPPPPEKGFQRTQMQDQQRQQWEPQYKHRGAESEYVFDEPGALYLMQQHRQAEAAQQSPSPRRSEDKDEDQHSDNSEHSALTNPMSVRSGAPLQFAGARATPPPRATPSPGTSPSPSSPRVPVSPVPRRHAPGGFEVVSGAVGTAALATVGGGASVRSTRSGSLPDTGSYTATSPTLGGAFPGGPGSGGGGNVGTSPGPGLAAENGSGSRGLGRRPSGARAPQQPQSRVAGGKRFVPTDSPSSLPREADEDAHSLSFPPPPQSGPSPQAQTTPSLTTSPQPSQVGSPHHRRHVRTQIQMATSLADDETVDALAALSFLEQHDAPQSKEPPARATSSQSENVGQQEQRSPPPAGSSSLPPPPTIMEPEDRAPSPPSQQPSSKPYRSSFAPSKQAAERKARSAAQQAAHEEVLHKPGRPNGKQRAKQREGGWESSEEEEDEEEEEEEEEEDDVNTDDEVPRTASRGPPSGTPSIAAPVGRNPMVQQQMRGLSPSNSASEEYRDQQGQQRAVRTLPQIPQRGRSPAGSARGYDQYEAPREASVNRPQSYLPPQLQQNYQPPGAARQNIWSSVLDTKTDTGMPGVNNNNSGNNRDTFVQIETPAETMTKAFTPQGLLSAGMQDKEERSAKRQEELARETGGSLINVPNKPPPPQVGLLGAITAHERERKREGGMGATLTEREREKRLAEERQRRLDELQKQQLEQQQQFSAQFGGMYGGGGLTPQMTGMNPMMGGFPGYPQMMGPQSMYFNPMFPMMNPQHMYAAQQAAQAYQQAMLAMSTAGSQAGGPSGGNDGNATGGGDRMSQNMNPMGMGNMPMGFDPRMSMMSMGGMMPMMPSMGGMSPMGMQMTGGSGMGSPGGGPMGGMDPRFSLSPGAFDNWGGGATSGPLGGGNTPGGSGQQSQRASAYNGSPRGSPAPPNREKSGNGNAEESTAKA